MRRSSRIRYRARAELAEALAVYRAWPERDAAGRLAAAAAAVLASFDAAPAGPDVEPGPAPGSLAATTVRAARVLAEVASVPPCDACGSTVGRRHDGLCSPCADRRDARAPR
jgi:hypothetical protein